MVSLRLLVATLITLLAASLVAQQDSAEPLQEVETQDNDDAILAPLTETGHALTREDVDAWLDGFVPYALKTGDIAGAVVVVVKDGSVLTQRGYGFADVEQREPVDPELTLFRPGSVSKLVTWTAVMQLVEEDQLELDRDVNDYLDFHIQLYGDQPVTLRQIMTHTSGFEETVKNLIFYDPDILPSLGDYLKAWVPNRIFAPNTTPAYSNYATALAGYIVERVSGQSFDDYVDEHIFAPLDMQSSTFRQPLPEHLADRVAQGYEEASGDPLGFELVGPAPAGSLSSTGADMAKFMIAHLQLGTFGGNRILRPETARMMHDTPHTVLPPLNRMELGFFETNINGLEVIAHLGDTVGFHTALHLFLEQNVGLYVSTNSIGKRAAAHYLRLALFEDFADRYFPSELPDDGGEVAAFDGDHAKKMVGVWRPSRRSESNFIAAAGLLGGQMKISVGPDGELVIPQVLGLNGEPSKWVEVEPYVWHDPDSHERVAAEVEDGEVVRLSRDLLSPFIVYDRVPALKSSAWLVPALVVGMAAMALTFLLWPIGAVVRRHYGAVLVLQGPERRAYRACRIVSGLTVALLIGWVVTIMGMFENIERLTSAMDPLLWFLQIAGLFVFVGGMAVMLWNAWVVWHGTGRWPSKAWSLVLVFAAAVSLWTAYAFKLLALTVNY